MKIKNLTVGKVIKNYKSLCELLEVEAKPSSNTNGRKAQHKEFNRYFEFEKQGQKYIITKIFDKPKEKIDNRKNNRGGNNSVFKEDFKKLMIYMLHKNRSECMLLSKSAMYKAMNLVNENYLLGRNNIPKLSEIIELPQASIYEFYDCNGKKLRETVERNLRSCRRESLLIFETVTSVAILESIIATNEFNKPIIDNNGKIVSDVKLVYREATKQERKKILEFEKEVKNENGWKDNQEIFLKGKWKYFKQQVEKRLKEANTNIKFYYEAYRITWNNKDIDEEYKKICSEISSVEIKNNINHNMVESIKKSTMKRHDKACIESGLELNPFKQDKLFEQEKIDYVIEQEQLTMTLISNKAPSLKNEFEKLVDYKKVSNLNKTKNNIEQLELDWNIGDEIPF